MKLEEAVKKVFWYSEDRKAVGSVREVGVDEFEAILALLSHAESTRWRKLEEEKPENLEEDETGEFPLYQCYVPSHPGNMRHCQCEWRPRRETKDGPIYWGFVYDVTHWRPIVGPEEES